MSDRPVRHGMIVLDVAPTIVRLPDVPARSSYTQSWPWSRIRHTGHPLLAKLVCGCSERAVRRLYRPPTSRGREFPDWCSGPAPLMPVATRPASHVCQFVPTLIGAFVGLAAGIVSIIGLYRATLRASAREWHAEQWVAATRAAGSPSSPPRERPTGPPAPKGWRRRLKCFPVVQAA